MGDFHCPMNVAFYDDEGCILCEMCSANTEEEMVAASKKIRAHLISQAAAGGQVKKIAVAGKGGVGKSTTTVLLARALAAKGRDVIVLDTDESNAGLLKLFGFEREPKALITLLPRFSSGESTPDVDWLKAGEITTATIPSEYVLTRPRLKFLMVGKIQDPFQGCACSMADMSRDLIGKLALAENEIVLVDMEAGVESFGRGVERNMDTVLVVVEPSLESITLADKINYMAQGMGIKRVMAIHNKIASAKALEKINEELKKRNVKVAGAINLDPHLAEASLEGIVPADCQAARDAVAIIDTVLQGTGADKPGTNS